jgi:hypothetical protein
MKTWTQPLSDGTSRTVSGHHFGHLGLTRQPDGSGWQLDHIATGQRVFPTSGIITQPLGYNKIRSLATRIGYSDLWTKIDPAATYSGDPVRKQLKAVITQVILDLG